MKYFGTDGIRGRVNSKHINGDMFFKFGLAAGKYFTNLKKKKQTAIIAKDTRLSGYTLEPALVSGLTSAGMHVFTMGPMPTNALAMLTKSMNANLGIMITASHNQFYDNGLKLFGPDGLKLSNKIENKIILIVGAGGATRGIIKPLLDANIKELHILNRTEEKAIGLAAEFSKYGEVSGHGIKINDFKVDIIINATSSSLDGEAPQISDKFYKNSFCYDLMYGSQLHLWSMP